MKGCLVLLKIVGKSNKDKPVCNLLVYITCSTVMYSLFTNRREDVLPETELNVVPSIDSIHWSNILKMHISIKMLKENKKTEG